MMKDKVFETGELCLIPIPCVDGIQHAYGIIIKRNPLKLRNDFYSVFYNGKIKEHENLFISKIEETQYES